MFRLHNQDKIGSLHQIACQPARHMTVEGNPMPPGYVLGAVIRRAPFKPEYARRGDISVGQVLAQKPLPNRRTADISGANHEY
ncbi:hypothetical protein OUHCRE20_06120 [Enterobacter hormaechei subsp. steigerwaltii]|uniref:Uncharacterized protein n=1 Tax=Enterobacter cloacae TaxID=550 RepID=A0ABD0BRI1_ENTCL|nr:hypothetical protein SL264_26550 [Enterobacter cloacae]BCZ62876.1 hypothetical protein SL269_26600 [Klebsiella aerogenes]GJJ82827.1 hypothetical protein TUM16652_15260 [Enterobacter cloacae]